MRFRPYACLALWALSLIHPAPAHAHPHLWITYTVEVQSTETGINALHFLWRIDPMFTAMIQEDFQLKTITEKDSKLIHDKAFANLKKFHYFMNIQTDGTAFAPENVQNFKARLNKDQLEYDFVVALPKPAQKIEMSLFDPEFYVDIEPPLQEVAPTQTGKSMMAEATLKPKDFVTTKGPKPAVCDGHDGTARKSDQWGEYPTFVITCHMT